MSIENQNVFKLAQSKGDDYLELQQQVNDDLSLGLCFYANSGHEMQNFRGKFRIKIQDGLEFKRLQSYVRLMN